ncbi:MAG: CDC27 family protein [Sulfurovum sp.]|nr:CDC27 family protein [Sulfurovaceae bacterium]
MYNMELLEKQWRIYKIKQILPFIGFTFILSLSLVYILNRDLIFNTLKIYFPEDNNISKNMAQSDAPVPPTIVKEVKAPEKCIEVNKTKVIVPKIQVENIKVETVPNQVNNRVNDTTYNENIDKEIAVIKEDKEKEKNNKKEENNSKPKMSIEFSEDEIKEANIAKPHRRKYLNIIVTDKDSGHDNDKIFDTLSIVEDRYNKNNNYRDALYLADGYYEQGDYETSQKWALVSNSLNSNSEDSWLLFAKSKAKLGNYKVAEDILEAYLKENRSKQAEELLKKMQLGKF